MAFRNMAYYAALVIGLLVLVGIGLSVISALLGFVWNVVTTLVALFVVGVIGYLIVKSTLRLRGGSDDSDDGGESIDSADPAFDRSVDRLTERYVEGELSESEFERRIERELETERLDDEIGRNPEYERSN